MNFKKFEDENGYISNLEAVHIMLKNNNYKKEDIIKILSELYLKNKEITKNITKENRELLEFSKKTKLFNEKNYEKKIREESIIKEKNIILSENGNYNFYIDYIENNYDNDFLNILPKNNDDNSLKIIDMVIIHYLREINLLKYNLVNETNDDDIKYIQDNLIKDEYIYNKIYEYKNNLININLEEEETLLNNVVYFMNEDIPYVYYDIMDDPDSLDSIIKLIESIEIGTFKNIKAFSNNDKFRGLFEVRDITNKTRVIFDMIGKGQYCIIYALTNKTDTNSIYKEQQNNYNSFNADNIKKLVKGDINE